MSDVLDRTESGSGFRGRWSPTPAFPLPRVAEDSRELDRAVALRAVRECLLAVVATPGRSRLGRIMGADPLGSESRGWYRLVEEQRGLAPRLAGAHRTVLHSVPTGRDGEDVDHLVIGEFGAVAVTVVDGDGRRVVASGSSLRIGPHDTRTADRAAELREDVASRLGVAAGRSIPVIGVVVVVDAAAILCSGRSTAPVLTADQLVRWLDRLDSVLSPDEADRLGRLARSASVWRERPDDAEEDAAAVRGFDALVTEVVGARRRRATWEISGLVAVISAMVAVASGLPATLLALLH